jgi:molecular chaperone GrpE
MNHTKKEQLLEQFAQYLEQVDEVEINSDQVPDLATLFAELAALKTEVKTESRYLKTTLDSLNIALETLKADNLALSKALAGQQAEAQQQQSKLLLGLLDLYDRVAAGLAILVRHQPVSSLFGFSSKQDAKFIESLKEGQSMTVKRFEQFLQQYQITAIDTVGKPLDPHTMNAVETDYQPKLDGGIVTEELRKGFLYADGVLRTAEVKVNKKPQLTKQ